MRATQTVGLNSLSEVPRVGQANASVELEMRARLYARGNCLSMISAGLAEKQIAGSRGVREMSIRLVVALAQVVEGG